MNAEGSRSVVLTGTILSLIVLGLAVFIHNTLYRKDLERASLLRHELRALLDAPETQVTGDPREGSDFESALLQMPNAIVVDSLPMFEEAERAAFARGRRGGGDDLLEDSGARLVAARDVFALHEAGAVSLSWFIDPATRALGESLPAGDSIVHRIARTDDPRGTPRFVATVPGHVSRWRDTDLPLAGGTLGYRVWTSRLRGAGGDAEPLLVDSQSSDLVTVTVPERFTLSLLGGDSDHAVIRVVVGPPGQPVAEGRLEVAPGEALQLGSHPLGLTLESLVIVPSDRLTTREHLVFKSDGSLVLDPETGEPRRDESQVLLAVNVLIATLGAPSGSRTLECDLP